VLINDTFNVASNYKLQVTGDIYTSGSIAIGSSSVATRLLKIGSAITGATTAYGITFEGNIESTVTTNGIVYRSYPIVTGGALSAITHYIASKNAFIGGSTVTNQYGFFADASVIDATNNYGFYGNIASATGRWNLYMNGTAQNYINGNLGIGVTVPTVKLDVSGAGLFSSSVTAGSFIKSGGTSAQLLAGDGSVVTAGTNITISGGTISASGTSQWTTSGSNIYYNSGNVGIGTASPQAKLHSDSDILTGYYQNGTNGIYNALKLTNNTASNTLSGNGARIQFYNNANNGTTLLGSSIRSVNVDYGWASDLVLSSVQNNGYSTQTINDAIWIKNTGNVGIGTSSPTRLLSVNSQAYISADIFQGQNSGIFFSGDGSYATGVYGRNSGLDLVFQSNSAERARIASDGRFQVNNTGYSANCTATLRALSSTGTDRILECITISYTSAFYVQTNGSYFFAGSNLSDARTKKDINYLEESILDKVMKLKPASFRYKENEENIKGGFIAQDIKDIFPDLVTATKSDDEMMGVDYYGVIAILTKAIQEQQIQIEELKAKLK
jgi:hypothetical protein